RRSDRRKRRRRGCCGFPETRFLPTVEQTDIHRGCSTALLLGWSLERVPGALVQRTIRTTRVFTPPEAVCSTNSSTGTVPSRNRFVAGVKRDSNPPESVRIPAALEILEQDFGSDELAA